MPQLANARGTALRGLELCDLPVAALEQFGGFSGLRWWLLELLLR
jgi:hypothetical protein